MNNLGVPNIYATDAMQSVLSTKFLKSFILWNVWTFYTIIGHKFIYRWENITIAYNNDVSALQLPIQRME